MEQKINLVELLKDCPKGMELDCILYDDVTLGDVTFESDYHYDKVNNYPIMIVTKNGFSTRLTKYGQNIDIDEAKCVIFPKGKTTWEGFVPPCQFKDGDIVFIHTNALKCNLDNSWVAIFKEYRNNRCACYVCLCLSDLDFYYDKWEDELLCELCEIEESRLATEEEKAKLFQAIKDNGYKWNEETKTLEKLIEPKFKVGDIIEFKYHERSPELVVKIKDNGYILSSGRTFMFQDENAWELCTGKLDITTLKPFDKVLVRDSDEDMWCASIFSHTWKDKYFCVGAWHNQCISYEANKELLGTTNNPEEYGSR